jgi:Ras-related protein Rab-7A
MYRGAEVFFLVFDLTNSQSLQNLDTWYQEILHSTNSTPQQYTFGVIGNKLALIHNNDSDNSNNNNTNNNNDNKLSDDTSSSNNIRRVRREDVLDWCQRHHIPSHLYFETSAKDGTNVSLAFETVVKEWYSKNFTGGYRKSVI